MKQAEKTKQTHNKLMAAASSLIVDEGKGYNNVSVSAITKKAGVAKGTFYCYYKQKSDLIVEMSRQCFAPVTDQVPALAAGDVLPGLTHYLTSFMEIIVEKSSLQLARDWLTYVLNRENKQATKVENDISGVADLLTAFVKKGKLKEDTPVATLAQVLMTQLYGTLVVGCVDEDREPISATKDFCAQVLPSIMAPYGN